MTSGSSTKFLIACSAVVVLAFCFASDANAQRGFRIGRVLEAGGGQGFRLGGERFEMRFGGGQGTSIGTQRFGMRFGNGQGARFGGANFGTQFGGEPGTQNDQRPATTAGAPGTRGQGGVQNSRWRDQPTAPRPPLGQSVLRPAESDAKGSAMNPPTDNSDSVQNPGNKARRTPSFAASPAPGTAASPVPGAQRDIARQTEVGTEQTNTSRPTMNLEAPLSSTKGKSILVLEAPKPVKPAGESGPKSNRQDR